MLYCLTISLMKDYISVTRGEIRICSVVSMYTADNTSLFTTTLFFTSLLQFYVGTNFILFEL